MQKQIPLDKLDKRLLNELRITGLYQEILDLKAGGVSLEAVPPSLEAIRAQCHLAAEFIEESGCQSQKDAYRRTTPLMKAVREGNINDAQNHLARGDDIDARDKYGKTALMYAIQHNQPTAATFLIDRRAALFIRDTNGRRALEHAIQAGNLNQVQQLVRAGTDVTDYNSDKHTALMLTPQLPETREIFAFLAVQDYRPLKFDRPEIYAAQQKLIHDWVRANPQNLTALRQAMIEQNIPFNGYGLLNTLNDNADKAVTTNTLPSYTVTPKHH